MIVSRKIERDSDGWMILRRAHWVPNDSRLSRRWIAIPPRGGEMRRFWTERGARRWKARQTRKASNGGNHRYFA